RIKLQMQGPAAILWRSACWREGVRTCCCCGAEVALLFLQPSFEIVKLVHAVAHPGEAKLFEGVLIAARQISKNDHSAQNASAPQFDCFGKRRDGEPARSGPLQRPRHLDRAVAVRVGLYYSQDFDRGSYQPLDCLIIFNQLLPGNFDERPFHRFYCTDSGGGSASPKSSARFSNFVYLCRNARSIFPVGPLRCLAMISSARPCRSSRSGL